MANEIEVYMQQHPGVRYREAAVAVENEKKAAAAIPKEATTTPASTQSGSSAPANVSISGSFPPTLNANQVLSVLSKAASLSIGDGNVLMIPRYQVAGDDYGTKSGTVDGLNLKSVNANILTGAALFGLYKGGSQKSDDFSVQSNVDNKWHTSKATDADFKKAADLAGIDISGMSRSQAYDALNNRGKDFYAITSRGNADANSHWSALYRKDGDNLVPVNDKEGKPVVKEFSATWHAPYDDFASFVKGAVPALAMGEIGRAHV